MLEEQTFDTGTVSINYIKGPPTGPPLILLHGGAGSWRSFQDVIPRLVPNWQIYAPDFRGHGRSGRTPGDYRWNGFVQDIIAFLDHHFSEPVTLWGASFGGAIAVGVAAGAPETVRALVLEDPWLDLKVSDDDTRQFMRYRRNLVTSIRSLDEMIAALEDELVALPDHEQPVRRGEVEDEAEIRMEAEALLQLDPRVYTFGWDGRLGDSFNMDQILKRVTCPTLLLQADPALGGLVGDELADRAMMHLSQGSLVRITKAQHAILRSQPEAAMRAINQFLSSL